MTDNERAMEEETDGENEADKLFTIGEEHLDKGRLKAARQTFMKVIRLGEREGESWFRIAQTYFLSDNVSECEKALRKSLIAEPDGDNVWDILGLVLFQLDRPHEAEEAVRRALRLNPEAPGHWETLGDIMYEIGRDSEALTAYATANGLDPDNPHLLRSMGKLYLDCEICNKAMETFNRALELPLESKDLHETMYLVGRVHEAKDEFSEARECFKAVIAEEPAHEDALAAMARVTSGLGELYEAISYLQRALHAKPEDYESLVLLASLYENTGQYQLAEDTYRSAIRANEYDAKAHLALAKMLDRLGRVEEAELVRTAHDETMEAAEKHMEIDESIVPIIEELNDMGLRTWGSCSGLEQDHLDREPMAPYVSFDTERTHAHHHLFTIADMAGWTAEYGVNGWGVELDFDNEDQYERELAWKRLIEAAHTVMDRVPRYYGDLFAYLEKRCNLREEDGRSLWDCQNDLSFTQEFCNRHGLDFKAVKERLEQTGGYCDCEVLMNSAERILDNEELPKYPEVERGIGFVRP